MAGDQNYNNGTAFPCSNEQFTCGNPATGDASPGMSKREYTATAILAGMMASPFISDHAGTNKTDAEMVAGLAKRGVQYADALLAELAKP